MASVLFTALALIAAGQADVPSASSDKIQSQRAPQVVAAQPERARKRERR